jgi:hypothetical protein
MQERAIELLEYVKSGIARGVDPTEMIILLLDKTFTEGRLYQSERSKEIIKEVFDENKKSNSQ